MSAPLCPELRNTYNVRSMPIHKGDTVLVVRGDNKLKTKRPVKVTNVYRKKYVIYVASAQRNKANGTPVDIPIHPSNVVIKTLY